MALRGVWQLQKLVASYSDWGGSSRGIRWAKMRWKMKGMKSVKGEMMKQKVKKPHIPIELFKLWLRSPGLVVLQTLIEMLAYGTSADQVDEIARMGKSTILEFIMRFCSAIESIYTTEYLRRFIEIDLQRLLKKGEMRGFLGIIGSIGCMHWTWKNCPNAWQ